MPRGGTSTVVATRDRPAMLDGCLATLRAALASDDEIIVVDSASADAVAVRDVASAHGARYLRCDVPGASRARNVGWRAARHDIVAFVDDDTRVRPEWANALVHAFADASVGFVTGRLDVADHDRDAERPVAVFTLDEGFAITRDVLEPYGHGANHAARREVLERVRGFDERLGAGEEFRAAEDLDLWDRMLLAGAQGRYVPEMVGWHEQWRTRREYIGLDWSYGYGSGVRMSKLIRTDARRARRSIPLFFWAWGARLVVHHLREGKRFMAGLTAIRLSGLVVGLARGIVVPIRDGHLAPRRWHGPVRGDPRAGRH